MRVMAKNGSWVLLDSLQFVNHLFVSMGRDEPLETFLRRIFAAVVGKMMRYASCSEGLHLFSNAILDKESNLLALELDHLYLDTRTKRYVTFALESPQANKRNETDCHEPDAGTHDLVLP